MDTITAESVVEIESRIATLEKELMTLRDQLEYAQTLAGIKRGLAAADRGEGIPIREVDRRMRAKYNIPPR